jgi:hypothetical protein
MKEIGERWDLMYERWSLSAERVKFYVKNGVTISIIRY